MVGDFGTPKRANYTAVGNCINMASRLESAARDLNVDIVISETTAQALQGTAQTPQRAGPESRLLTPIGTTDIRGFGPNRVYSISS